MGIEIERKFLLKNDSWRQQVIRTSHIAQAYLNKDGLFSSRVRLQTLEGSPDSINLLTETNKRLLEANINIKTCELGMSRSEYTYDIPINDAQEIFNSSPWQIYKKRHYIEHAGLTWEIDEFIDRNSGLIVAEVELESESQDIVFPDWVGLELTDDQRYYNHALSFRPYTNWVSHIEVDTVKQSLITFNPNGHFVRSYSVSTAKNGLGEQKDSYQTPRGLHQIRAKIGEGAQFNSVFKGRRLSGEVYTPELAETEPERDWILSRILWLSGLEKNKNRLGNVDTMQRYVYIHGSPENEQEPFGEAHSHGCIRMRSEDIIELFEACFIGSTVMII